MHLLLMCALYKRLSLICENKRRQARQNDLPCLSSFCSGSAKRRSGSMQNVQSQSQDDESGTDPLGGLSELGIEGLGVTAGEESVSSLAADAAGQTGVLTGLEQNRKDNNETAQKLKNGDDGDNCLHDE